MRPGIYDLGTVVITAARTGDVITEGNSVGASVPYVADLGGMSGVARWAGRKASRRNSVMRAARRAMRASSPPATPSRGRAGTFTCCC